MWREMLARGADIALVALGVVLFAAGSVALARPLVTRGSTLFVKVTVTATVGIAFLGVIALVVAWIAAIATGEVDSGTAQDVLSQLSSGTWRRRRR